jgi:hypothetical protein
VGRWLDGEGVFEFLHPRLQILDFSPLLFDEQVFNAVEARLYQLEFLLDLCAKLLDVLFAGHGFIDELGQALYGCDLVLRHMSLSIAGRRGVSMEAPVVTEGASWQA